MSFRRGRARWVLLAPLVATPIIGPAWRRAASDHGGRQGVVEALTGGWFRVAEPEPDVFLIEEPLHDEVVKSYLIVGSERAVLLDAGTGAGDLPAVVASLTDRPLTLVVSHAHWDHIGHAAAFAGAGAEVLIDAAQAPALAEGVGNERMRTFFAPERLAGPLPDGFDLGVAAIPPVATSGRLTDGQTLDLGGRRLEVVTAPGHAPGLATLLDREHGLLFSTDAAYDGALYAQFDDADLPTYVRSLQRLAALAPKLRAVYPSHGPAPIPPARLVAIRDAVAAVAAGREADELEGGVAKHLVGDVEILVAR